MKTRILHTRIYSDNFFVELSPIEKLLFIYLLTNENVNIIHFYECPDRKIMFDTGLTSDQLIQAKEKFQKAGKMYFNNGFIYLKNADKYEHYSGSDNEKAKENLINQLSKEMKEWYTFLLTGQTTDTPVERGVTGVYTPTINHNTEIINNNKEIIKGVVKGEKKLETQPTPLLDPPDRSINFSSRTSIHSLTDKDMQEVAKDYNVPITFVISKADDIKNYCASKGKVYRDYKAALRNWVKRDALERREVANGKSRIAIITPDPAWEST